MEFISEELINIIEKDIDSDPEKKPYIQVRFTYDEWDAVNTCLFHLYNHFCVLEERGRVYSSEMNKFINNLQSGYDKVNNADEVMCNYGSV